MSVPAADPAPAWNASPQMSTPPTMTVDARMQRTSGKAIAALVLGIVGFCIAIYLGIICGIIALVLGIMAMKEVDRSNGMVKGKGMAITGIVLGSIGILVQLVIVIFFGALIAGALGGDWEEIQRCTEDPEAPGCEEYQAEAPEGPGLPPLAISGSILGFGPWTGWMPTGN